MLKQGLYFGTVYHARHQPFHHEFKYKVVTFFLDIDSLEDTAQTLKLFSFNRFNIFSFYNRDHAKRNGKPIRPWIEKAAADKGIDLQGGKIFMLGFCRMWGYLFNPLTVFYCFDRHGKLKAVMHQVKNTFGEQHSYFIPVSETDKDFITQKHDKVFHVSPFIEMDCHYDFKFNTPGKDFFYAIHQSNKKGKMLTATWDGKYFPLTDRNLLRAMTEITTMSFKVIFAIHWEALKLWLKGAKYIKKPKKPKKEVS